MGKVQGQVQQVERKTSPKSGKAYYRVQVNGEWLSTWEQPEYKAGDHIEYNIVQKGDFKNLADVEVVENAGPTSPAGVQSAGRPTVSTSRPNGSFDSDRESRIVRQNAFSSAAVLVAALVGVQAKKLWDPISILELTTQMAKQIFAVNMYGYPPSISETASQGGGPPASKEAGADELFKY